MTADQVRTLATLRDLLRGAGLAPLGDAVGAALAEATDPGPDQVRAFADKLERYSGLAQAVIDAARAAAPAVPEGAQRDALAKALAALDAGQAV